MFVKWTEFAKQKLKIKAKKHERKSNQPDDPFIFIHLIVLYEYVIDHAHARRYFKDKPIELLMWKYKRYKRQNIRYFKDDMEFGPGLPKRQRFQKEQRTGDEQHSNYI